MNLMEIVINAREKGIEKYDSLAQKTNADIGKEMILFSMKTLRTRKVSDWGRDEDTDKHIGLSREGWIEYTHKIEYLAGPKQITESSVRNLTDEQVVAYLNSEDCTNSEFLEFMNTAYKLSPTI